MRDQSYRSPAQRLAFAALGLGMTFIATPALAWNTSSCPSANP